jgi:hypothetical protein
MPEALAFLLSPLSVADFRSRYQSKHSVHIAGSADKFSDLFDLPTMRRILNAAPFPHPTMKLVLEGQRLTASDASAVVEHCRNGATLILDARLVVGPGGALANAVVELVGVTAGKPVPRDPVMLDNEKCSFVPHVRSATRGQTLEIHNSDPFLHDAHAWMGTRSLFNVGILPGHTSRQPLADAGLIHINCNVRHTWMHAYVVVADDPYHALTGADGRFTIDQVPPGNYTLHIWHELLGSIDRPVTIEGGKTATVDIAFPMVAPVPPGAAP